MKIHLLFPVSILALMLLVGCAGVPLVEERLTGEDVAGIEEELKGIRQELQQQNAANTAADDGSTDAAAEPTQENEEDVTDENTEIIEDQTQNEATTEDVAEENTEISEESTKEEAEPTEEAESETLEETAPVEEAESETLEETAPEEEAAENAFLPGTYTHNASYVSPGGQEVVAVTFTIENDIITAVEVSAVEAGSVSKKYISLFDEGIKELAIGTPLNQLQEVDAVNGSSLTGTAFNAALTATKSEAAS